MHLTSSWLATCDNNEATGIKPGGASIVFPFERLNWNAFLRFRIILYVDAIVWVRRVWKKGAVSHAPLSDDVQFWEPQHHLCNGRSQRRKRWDDWDWIPKYALLGCVASLKPCKAMRVPRKFQL